MGDQIPSEGWPKCFGAPNYGFDKLAALSQRYG